mmetsp:Transcript_20929/g.57588  ORF Transcript_20929/g.57588 Transcript_20929/m.57588 type:complete len:84 (-) Transcript_20929:53-304(-)
MECSMDSFGYVQGIRCKVGVPTQIEMYSTSFEGMGRFLIESFAALIAQLRVVNALKRGTREPLQMKGYGQSVPNFSFPSQGGL